KKQIDAASPIWGLREQALSRNDLIIRSFCAGVQVGLVGMDRTLFKLSVEIPQGGSYIPSGAVMAKWGLACDVACHPPKRVKITARGNDVKNELICDLASRKEPLEAHHVFFVRTNRLRLEQEYCLDD